MPIGTKIVVTVLRNANGTFGGIENVKMTKFSHAAGASTTNTVLKEDIANTGEDRYHVSTSWIEGDANMPVFTSVAVTSPPVTSVTGLGADALTKINAVFPGTFS